MGKSLRMKKAVSCSEPSNMEEVEIEAVKKKGESTTIESPTRKTNIASIEKKIKQIREQMEKKEAKTSKISSFLWSDSPSQKP